MTIHVTSAIDITKVKTRWEEPYVSEAIDKMMAGLGEGIHHGFRMTADGGQIIRLSHDTEFGDSLALIQDDGLGQTFVYREDTELTLDLTAVGVGTRAWVYLFVDYSVSVATSAEVRVVDSAELANPWVSRSLLLGTVRKPAAGAIDDGDIDHGSAGFLGLAKGDSSRWVAVSQNTYFEKGLAGFELGGAGASTAPFTQADYVTLVGAGDAYRGDRAARLGDISGSQPTPETGELKVNLPQLVANDIVLWRFKAKSSSVTNGAVLRVDLGAYFSETVLDADLGSYEQFGYAVEITADDDDQTLDIVADLTAGATATGFFDIDEVEVYIFRPTGTVAAGNMDVASRRLMSDAGAITARFEAGAGAWSLSDANASFDLTDSVDGTGFADLPSGTTSSLMSGLNHALRGGGAAFDLMFPKAVLTAGVNLVTDGGTNTVDVASFSVRTTSLVPDVDGTVDRYFEQGAVSGLALPTTAGVEEFFVVWDPDTEDVTAFLTSAIGSNPDVVILAYVEHDSGTATNTRITQMRDVLLDLERKMPFTVGSLTNARFLTLEAAFKMVSASGFSGPKEFVVVGTANVRGVVLSGDDVPVVIPAGSLIRGDGGARLNITSNAAAGTIAALHAPSGGNVVIRDIEIGISGVATNNVFFLTDEAGAPKNVILENVREVTMETSSKGFQGIVSVTPTELLAIRDCRFRSRSADAAVNPTGGGACVTVNNTTVDLRVEIVNSVFGGLSLGDDYTDNDRALDVTNDFGTAVTVISGCEFREANREVLVVGESIVSDCFALVPVSFDGSSSKSVCISNVKMDVTSYLTDATTPLTSMFNVDDTRRGIISNVSVDATDNRGTPDIALNAMSLGNTGNECVYQNLTVRHTDGNAFQFSGNNECNVVGLVAESNGADVGRRGITCGLVLNSIFDDIVLIGYGTDAAINANTCTDSIFGIILVAQSGGVAEFGFSNEGTNNTILHAIEK